MARPTTRWTRARSRLRALPTPVLVAAPLAVILVATSMWWANRPADLVVGVTDPTTTVAPAGPTIPVETTTTVDPAAGGAGQVTLLGPDGRPYGPALAFSSSIPVRSDLVFVLVAGSDARPSESVTRTRADSIHLVAIDPQRGAGTVVGIPRDTWVRIPGHGDGKINSALALGGPQLLAEAVRGLTGLPVHYYVLTGFGGFQSMVNALGGIDVHVERRMADKNSGAYFEPGWHHFDGAQALAYTRDRNDVPGGDVGRSRNQGRVIMSALAKLGAEVSDDGDLGRWLDVLARHAVLDASASELRSLAATARTVVPDRVDNVVIPVRNGKAGSQSVVFADPSAGALFEDLRADAVIGGGTPPTTQAPTTTSQPTATTHASTTTTSPATSTTTTVLIP